jgi:hypothetical protein
MKKSIHVSLLKETHAGLKIKSFEFGLSMTEMIEEFAQLVIIEDPHMMNILNELVSKKRNREARKLSNTDAESILDMISEKSLI